MTASATAPRRRRNARPDAGAELARLADKLADAERQLDHDRRAEEHAQAEQQQLGELDADEYLGSIDPHEYARRRAAIETHLVEARQARERSERIVETVRRRAADLADEIGYEAELAAHRELEQADARVAEARRELHARERARARAAERRVAVRRERSEARARFDPKAAQAAAQARQQRNEQVESYARMPRWRDGEIPRALRDEVAAKRAELAARERDERERTREAADASWRELLNTPYPFDE